MLMRRCLIKNSLFKFPISLPDDLPGLAKSQKNILINTSWLSLKSNFLSQTQVLQSRKQSKFEYRNLSILTLSLVTPGKLRSCRIKAS